MSSSLEKLITVIMPLRNGERHLAPAVESVLRQTHWNLELIIVDDFSNDGSAAIVDLYARKDPRVKYFRTGSPQGFYASINLAMEQSLGTYIKLLRQDSILSPEALESTVRCFEKNDQLSIVATGYQLIDEYSEPLSSPQLANASLNAFPVYGFEPNRIHYRGEVLDSCLFPLTNLVGDFGTVTFKAGLESSGFDERLTNLSELDYFLRLIMKGDFYLMSDNLVELREPSSDEGELCLMEGADIMKMSRKYSRVIAALGKSESSFIEMALEGFVSRVRKLLDAGKISEESLRKASDLLERAAMERSTHFSQVATATVTSIFEGLSFDFSPNKIASVKNPLEEADSRSTTQDLVDMRLFTYYLVKRLIAEEKKKEKSDLSAHQSAEFISEAMEPVMTNGAETSSTPFAKPTFSVLNR